MRKKIQCGKSDWQGYTKCLASSECKWFYNQKQIFIKKREICHNLYKLFESLILNSNCIRMKKFWSVWFIFCSCANTGCRPEDLPKAIDVREVWQERVRNIRADSTTWWWWWWCLLVFCILHQVNTHQKLNTMM